MQPVTPSTTLGQYSTGVLDDGRTVTILIPWQWQTVDKCNRKSRCTNWSCSQCYDASFASSPYSQYWHHGNGVVPRLVAKNSNSKYWFVCGTCGHEFDSKLSDVTKGSRCPYCSNPPQWLCQYNTCQQCYTKSFASHPHAHHWHPTANGTTRARDVFLNSGKKYWFVCNDCGHEFDSTLKHIVKSDSWCPYCASQRLCHYENCQHCYNKSFASHPYAQYWHPTANGAVRPRDAFLNCNSKVWFLCPDCEHPFDSTLNNIVTNGSRCPYCSNPPQRLCQYDNCQHCHSKSFASHPYAQHWHPTANNCRPRDVFKCSAAKYTFSCHVCRHVFSSVLSSITAGRWCPACNSSSLERRAADQLQRRGWQPTTDPTDGQPQRYMTQFAIGRRRYDLYLPSLRVVIELDGIQHFEENTFFQTPLQQQQLIDLCKNRAATQQGLAVVRISYQCDVEQCIDWVLQQPPLSATVHFSQPALYQAWHTITVTPQQYQQIMDSDV